MTIEFNCLPCVVKLKVVSSDCQFVLAFALDNGFNNYNSAITRMRHIQRQPCIADLMSIIGVV